MERKNSVIMKKILLLASLLGIMSACGPTYIKPEDASQTSFDVAFFKSVNATVSKNENVIVSPYSAGVVFSMLAEGAEGQTKVEFDNALGGALFKAVDLGGDKEVTVKSANSVWIDDNFSPHNRYVSLLEKDFDAFLTTQNFADPATVHAINNWCSENTDGKISDILDKLDPSNVMVLINALYFNAPWEEPFETALTTDQTFNGLSKKSQVKMMSRKGQYLYAEESGFQIIQLPYQGLRYAMYVILPPEGTDINRMLGKVDGNALLSAMDLMQMREVKFMMPRFKAETSMILNKAMQNMGIKSAFTSAADFSGIAQMGPLVLDQVKQKCYIDVTETGTEAAAVTLAQIRLTAVRPMADVTEMRVDRPFVFVIADGENMNILFAGKIVNL